MVNLSFTTMRICHFAFVRSAGSYLKMFDIRLVSSYVIDDGDNVNVCKMIERRNLWIL